MREIAPSPPKGIADNSSTVTQDSDAIHFGGEGDQRLRLAPLNERQDKVIYDFSMYLHVPGGNHPPMVLPSHSDRR